MSQIRVIYHPHPVTKDPEPNFPASDQHPDAERYFVWADGSITRMVTETPKEVQAIDLIAARVSDLGESSGKEVRRAEALKRLCEQATLTIASVEAELEACEPELLSAGQEVLKAAKLERADLERQADDAMAKASKLTADHGAEAAFAMDEGQRRFLARLQVPEVRMAFIDCSRKMRRKIMEEREKPVLVVDAIGAPTMDEISKLLTNDDKTPTAA